MSLETICGKCDFFIPYQNQPPKGLISEAGRKGLCLNPSVAVDETFEEWTPITAIIQSYYKDDLPYWIQIDGICFKSQKNSETYLYLPLE